VEKRALISVILLVAASCGGGDGGSDVEVAVPVSVEEISPGSIEEYVVATGTVNASKEVAISAEVTGEYNLLENPGTGKPFALGDVVERGTRIIRLVNPEEENTIRIDAKKLTLETTRLEYEQQKSLFEKGGVTRLELSQAERSYIDAKYDYDNALIRLSKMHITAPFDGVITSLPYYTPGVEVAQGTELLGLQEYSRLQLEVSLPGKELGRLEAGQHARIMNYTLPDDTLRLSWPEATRQSSSPRTSSRSSSAERRYSLCRRAQRRSASSRPVSRIRDGSR
jgi:membrane fusion protein (multidrug efflux system)